MSKRLFWASSRVSWVLLPITFLAMGACSSDETPAPPLLLKTQDRNVAIIAHRGASGLAPENTLAAVKLALTTDAHFIEVDVHQSKDGEVVVIHDATVDRTTNGKGKVSDLTLPELKKLVANVAQDSSFSQERIPTLAEVLQAVKGKKKLLIELKKGADGYYEGLEANTLRIIGEHKAGSWCVLQSFHDPILERIWQSDFVIPTHKLIVGKIPFLPVYIDHTLQFGSLDRYAKARAINVHRSFASKSFIKLLHRKGFKTFIWTEDAPENIQRLFDMGADGVMTNHPERVSVR